MERISTEHGLWVKVVVLLGEIDRRGIYRDRAWPSLFEYCVAHLKYSEVHEIFERREITLTNLSKVSRMLTEENHVELAKAVGTQRKDEAERVIAKWFPQPDVKPLIRQLPTPTFTPKPIALPVPAPPPAPVHIATSAIAPPKAK